MLPFLLYFITAVITGYHVYSLMSLAAYGAPVSPLEFVALLGSLCLLICAYISLFRPVIAAKIALIAALFIWSFYAPALANLIRVKVHDRSVLSQSHYLTSHFE
jgi:hypothetical protein